MILYPTLDIRHGAAQRVRREGGARTQLALAPAEEAARLATLGFKWLHVTDLDGADYGSIENREAIRELVRHAPLQIQLTGGMRSLETLDYWIEAGVPRLALGASAIADDAFRREALHRFPGRLAVIIEARDGWLISPGTIQLHRERVLDLALRLEEEGAAAIICRDSDEAGGMGELNIEAIADLAMALTIPVVAHGGISTLADLRLLKGEENTGIDGLICGPAFFDGRLDLAAAQALLTERNLGA